MGKGGACVDDSRSSCAAVNQCGTLTAFRQSLAIFKFKASNSEGSNATISKGFIFALEYSDCGNIDRERSLHRFGSDPTAWSDGLPRTAALSRTAVSDGMPAIALVDGLVLATASLPDEVRLATALPPDEMPSKLGDTKEPDWNGYTMLVTAVACP